MIGNLEKDFEELLDNEAARVFGRILLKYERKEKVNKSLEQLVSSLVKKEFKYFYFDISCKVRRMLPKNLDEDLSMEYALTTRDDHLEQWLTGYEKYCVKVNEKDHKTVSKEIAEELVKYCDANPSCNENITYLVVEKLKLAMPDHNDSVDCRTILMYLQQEIMALGYIITNLEPLRIDKQG